MPKVVADYERKGLRVFLRKNCTLFRQSGVNLPKIYIYTYRRDKSAQCCPQEYLNFVTPEVSYGKVL